MWRLALRDADAVAAEAGSWTGVCAAAVPSETPDSNIDKNSFRIFIIGSRWSEQALGSLQVDRNERSALGAKKLEPTASSQSTHLHMPQFFMAFVVKRRISHRMEAVLFPAIRSDAEMPS